MSDCFSIEPGPCGSGGGGTLAGDATGPLLTNVVERVQGTEFDATPPTNGQVPVYNATAAKAVWTSIPGVTPAKIYSCPMAAVRGNLVYETAAADTVVLANATDETKAPALGVISTKPSATTCTIQQVGPMDGVAGLPADQSELFLGTTDGGFTDTAPTGTGKVVQPVGRVVGPTSVEWHIDPENYTVRA